MKSHHFTGLALGSLLLLSLSACNTEGENLEGNLQPVAPILSLAVSSPSEGRSVSATDNVLVLNLEGGATRTSIIPAGGSFGFTFTSKDTDGDIDPAADGNTISLRNGEGDVVGTGALKVIDTFSAEATVVTTADVVTPAGNKQNLTLSIDSASLLTEDAGEDDLFTVTASYNRMTVTGNTVKY